MLLAALPSRAFAQEAPQAASASPTAGTGEAGIRLSPSASPGASRAETAPPVPASESPTSAPAAVAEPVAPPPPPTAPAAEAEAEHVTALVPLSMTGFVEAAYHLNMSDSSQGTPVPLRSYDAPAANSLLLHNGHLAVKAQPSENVAGVIEIDAGTDAGITSGTGQLFNVQEAYGTYSNSGFSFTAGEFVTYEGIEVIEGPLNPTITRGFLFGLAEPYTYTGFKMHYAAGPMDVGVGLVNGWDLLVDNNDGKTIIIGFTPVKEFWAAVSGSFGPERTDNDEDKRISVDLTGAVIPSGFLTIYFQGNYGSEPNAALVGPMTGATEDGSWFGAGLQPLLTIHQFSLGARVEWFKDSGGSRSGVPGLDPSYVNFTITPGFSPADGFRLRGEYRIDTASEPVLNGEESQQTLAFGADVAF